MPENAKNGLSMRKTKTQELYQFLSLYMAGAEGLEPSARGFGAKERTF